MNKIIIAIIIIIVILIGACYFIMRSNKTPNPTTNFEPTPGETPPLPPR
jgi:uncharacterized protein YxeA